MEIYLTDFPEGKRKWQVSKAGGLGARWNTDGGSLRYTYTGGDHIYAVSLGWPGERIALHHVTPDAGSEIFLLGYDAPLAWEPGDSANLVITIPAELQAPENRPNPYAYVFKIRGSR